MKTFVLNRCYGGWGLSKFACEQLGIEDTYDFDLGNEEMFWKLVNLIEAYGSEKISGSMSKLKIVEIPDEVTDYEINEYDGIESITYVIDGKLYHA